ncbi:MAG: alpha-1,4-glucan--maltose-1-phosphate maltosyltransferase [Bacteroidia bacterium]|nr:alpha-1,4-glucan--maltose-1-phosphate maltosyltransferase [Bacteroidia bacterium]MDW8300836.1 alpha-1,4-glucan--maltose-1-phosphate maltosyltransferase [Bacteroidia bacterium]
MGAFFSCFSSINKKLCILAPQKLSFLIETNTKVHILMAQNRVIIENVQPEIDGGKYPAKRVVGQIVKVTADIFADGHDVIAAEVAYKHEKEKAWKRNSFTHLGNDAWVSEFKVEKQGYYEFKIEGWIDHALTWQHNIERKINDKQFVNIELLDGIQYLESLIEKVTKAEGKYLQHLVDLFRDSEKYHEAIKEALSPQLREIFEKYPQRKFTTTYDKVLRVYVDRKKALFSAWYEFFPRSTGEHGRHGTFKDCHKIIPRIAAMGFDTIYFPPIHPIGSDFKKGKNNSLNASPEDVGSCWAIGNVEGGHKDILPALGTLEDFKELIKYCESYGIEIAMDYALQCSPNHPYVKQYPQWFKWRPDGTVQYAENPPKKYQDILPINFETDDWKNLWNELLSILFYWIEVGIKIFRVDNPHTKSFRFWEWAISEVKKKYPDVIFLSEAFTRPKVMHMLAKLGFTQSYTYYTWRNTKYELSQYMTELTKGEGKEYFRPNFWPNTPDINPYILQSGNETLFMTRYFMAATLSSNYGIYGPVYELGIHTPIPGKEEYLDSEKYEIKQWDWDKKTRISELITLVNKIRKENPAFHDTNNLELCRIDNDQILAYFKYDHESQNYILCVVNLDPYNTQSGWVQVPLYLMGISEGHQLCMHDLLTGNKYIWEREWNYVELNPRYVPFHLFKIELR